MDTEYKIIGGDGVEYGPAPLDELKSWIRDGRVAGATQVWRNDSTAWLPALDYTELQPDLSKLNEVAALARVRSLVPAGFWSRLGAFLLDQFLISLLVSISVGILKGSAVWNISFPAHINNEAELRAFLNQVRELSSQITPIYLGIFLFYDVLMNGRFGATLGKMAIGARIIRVDGTPIGYQTALLRWAASRLSDMIFYIGYLVMLFQPQKRALHDFLAGTRVVFKK